MTSLTFYGGINEIGGNKILLETGGAKIWLDFGQPFNMGSDYYVGWLQPRSSRILRDLFEFNLIPRLKGLYSENLLEATGIDYEEPCFDGVFLSHAHMDHVNHISFLDPSIPVYAGTGTKLFMEAQEKTSPRTNYRPHDYRQFRTGDRLVVGDIEVKPIHVDHSIPGAYGYIIRTPEGSVVYTGDVRAHGPGSDMTRQFIEAAAEAEPSVMISEGTRMVRKEARRNLSEAQVLEGVIEVCSQAERENRIVLYTQGPRDMDRLRTFYTAAVRCGRSLVINTRTAHLLHRLVDDEHLDLPDPISDDCVKVYFRKKRSGEYREKDYFIWERQFLDKMVTDRDLKHHPGEYVVNMGFTTFTELIDIRPEPGSHFIYSMSEHLSEDGVEDAVMHNWLKHFNLRYHQLHASGHMSRKELLEMLETIKPKTLIPVHTEGAALFNELFEGTILPALGEKCTISH